MTPLTKTHACDILDTSHNRLLTPKQQATGNFNLVKKQTLLTSRYGQINTIKKDNTYKERKKYKLGKVVNPPTKISREKVTKQKPICYKCKKIGHYQNNCVSDKNPSKSTSKLKTVEITYSLKQSFESIQLLSRNEIDKNINNFSFIHFCLVQVVVKPLTRQGSNTRILSCLRNGRFKIYKDALLGMVELSLYKGPIYFNYYPNFVVFLTDKTVLQTLDLNIETSGYNML